MNMFNWCSFYKIGEMFEKSNNEAEIRTSVGRFYYAIFGHLRKLLIETSYLTVDEKRNLKRKTSNVHEEIIQVFEENKLNINLKNSKKIAYKLRTLRRMRNIADYNANEIFYNSDIQTARDNVKEINRLTENI